MSREGLLEEEDSEQSQEEQRQGREDKEVADGWQVLGTKDPECVHLCGTRQLV